MEYYLSRAMEVCRLSDSQLDKLHKHELKERFLSDYDSLTGTFKRNEKKESRCLMPFEIQEMFNLPPLKQVYLIPEVESDQSGHNQRLRNDFRACGLIKDGFDIPPLNVKKVHDFDLKAIDFNNRTVIDLVYRGGKSKKGKYSEDI